MRFEYPWWFFLLVVPLIFYLYYRRHKPGLGMGSVNFFAPSLRKQSKISDIPFYLFLISFSIVALMLTRPRIERGEKIVHTKGIDIMLLLDMSSSMKIPDFRPNRFYAAKEVIKEFIKGRKHDRIGLIAFARDAYTMCPLTIDYNTLLNILDQLQIGYIRDGTAIGMAIAEGVARLKNSKAPSKVMILLTDGENNAGNIDPVDAAKLARDYHIKIYTIGMGSKKSILRKFFGGDIHLNEDLLRKIAYMTGGKFYLATDRNALKRIYAEIDKMEKGKVEVKVYHSYEELFPLLGWVAFLMYIIAIFLENTFLLVVP